MNMKEARIKAHYTQERLADECCVIRQTISNIECGITLPSLPLARRICELLNCSWDIFF